MISPPGDDLARRTFSSPSRVAKRSWLVSFIVNSSPGAGFRFEPSATFPDAKGALSHAIGLATRGMRLIKIKNTETGEIMDEKGLRQSLSHVEGAL